MRLSRLSTAIVLKSSQLYKTLILDPRACLMLSRNTSTRTDSYLMFTVLLRLVEEA